MPNTTKDGRPITFTPRPDGPGYQVHCGGRQRGEVLHLSCDLFTDSKGKTRRDGWIGRGPCGGPNLRRPCHWHGTRIEAAREVVLLSDRKHRTEDGRPIKFQSYPGEAFAVFCGGRHRGDVMPTYRWSVTTDNSIRDGWRVTSRPCHPEFDVDPDDLLYGHRLDAARALVELTD